MPLPPDVPPEVAGFLQEMGYLDPDRLKVGDFPPILTLQRLYGDGTATIGGPDAARPTVLIFGSYT
jgi:hypothetical protein